MNHLRGIAGASFWAALLAFSVPTGPSSAAEEIGLHPDEGGVVLKSNSFTHSISPQTHPLYPPNQLGLPNSAHGIRLAPLSVPTLNVRPAREPENTKPRGPIAVPDHKGVSSSKPNTIKPGNVKPEQSVPAKVNPLIGRERLHQARRDSREKTPLTDDLSDSMTWTPRKKTMNQFRGKVLQPREFRPIGKVM